ncbi:hypothetical protein D3C71_1279400 [compost metagenome]
MAGDVRLPVAVRARLQREGQEQNPSALWPHTKTTDQARRWRGQAHHVDRLVDIARRFIAPDHLLPRFNCQAVNARQTLGRDLRGTRHASDLVDLARGVSVWPRFTGMSPQNLVFVLPRSQAGDIDGAPVASGSSSNVPRTAPLSAHGAHPDGLQIPTPRALPLERLRSSVDTSHAESGQRTRRDVEGPCGGDPVGLSRCVGGDLVLVAAQW